MTIEDLASWANANVGIWLALLAVSPVVAGVLALFDAKGRSQAVRTAFGFLVYLSCVPGTLCLALLLYSVVFVNANVLTMSLPFYGAPVVAMVATLVIIHKVVPLGEVRGFDRIEGLLILMTVSFVVSLVLRRLGVFLVFHGGMGDLLIIALALFLFVKFGAAKLLGPRKSSVR